MPGSLYSMSHGTDRRWSVVTVRLPGGKRDALVLPGGEEVPTLVDTATGVPARVAMRYVMRVRREHVKPSTIRNELHVCGRLYSWFWNEHQRTVPLGQRVDLDDYIVAGRWFETRDLDSLVNHLTLSARNAVRGRGAGAPGESPKPGLLTHPETGDGVEATDEAEEAEHIAATTLDRYARVSRQFLRFAVDAAKRGGMPAATWSEMMLLQEQLDAYFAEAAVGAAASIRIDPLSSADLRALREAVGPVYDVGPGGKLLLRQPITFTHGNFAPETRLRNWTMICVGRDLGFRRGEILKLTVGDIAPGRGGEIRVVRRPDDLADSRRTMPAVKTKARTVPSTPELDSLLTAYLAGPAPGRRVSGGHPYLFTGRDGAPLSIDTTAEIMETVRAHAGIPGLRWHSLRHTWAEAFIEERLGGHSGPVSRAAREAAFTQLKYAGGWHSDAAPRHYVQRFTERWANSDARARNERLYDEAESATWGDAW